MSSKTALPVALLVVVFLMAWPTAKLLAQNTCPGCSSPAKVVHPNGFGPESYARWIPMVGEPDSRGTNNFAMLLVHLSDVTNARAVVAVEGFDGEDPDGFTLAYDHPLPSAFPPNAKYSGCTMSIPMMPGNPRWSVRYRVLNASGATLTDNRFQFGCGDAALTDGIITGMQSTSAGQLPLTWERKSLALTATPTAVAGGT